MLTLVLRSLRGHSQLPLGPLGIEYGAKTYIPLVEQSDCSTSKFFAILKFIVSCLLCHAHLKRLCYWYAIICKFQCSKQHEHVDITKLITYLKTLTHCPPLVYALNILHEESYLKLPCWVCSTSLSGTIYRNSEGWRFSNAHAAQVFWMTMHYRYKARKFNETVMKVYATTSLHKSVFACWASNWWKFWVEDEFSLHVTMILICQHLLSM